jgi:inhibitor of KinA
LEKFELTYKSFGEEVLLIEWPSRIDEKILMDILSFQEIIEDEFSSRIIETQNTYHSLTIFFDDIKTPQEEFVAELKRIRKLKREMNWNKSKIWQLPVCYDKRFGIDLEEIAKTRNLTVEEIEVLHYSVTYRVYFTGFLPGFLYLGGLSEKLVMPRKETPRSMIVKGSVAIGGSQTGIYPQESPGGWNIIGNCPIPLFDVHWKLPCKIRSGDQVQFSPISMNEYEALLKSIQSGLFDLKPVEE